MPTCPFPKLPKAVVVVARLVLLASGNIQNKLYTIDVFHFHHHLLMTSIYEEITHTTLNHVECQIAPPSNCQAVSTAQRSC